MSPPSPSKELYTTNSSSSATPLLRAMGTQSWASVVSMRYATVRDLPPERDTRLMRHGQKDYVRRIDIANRGFSGYNTSNALEVLPKFFPSPQEARVRLVVRQYSGISSSRPCHRLIPHCRHKDTLLRCKRRLPPEHNRPARPPRTVQAQLPYAPFPPLHCRPP
jgi:hypothetical protein